MKASKKTVIRYHSLKMLRTLDLRKLLEVLGDEFGPNLEVELSPMTDSERAAAEDRSGPVTIVHTRLMIVDHAASGDTPLRREDLESRVIREGRK